MSIELMNKINNNYHMAMLVHGELATTFYFVGMEGYSLWNEYQYLSESLMQRRIRQYITSTYHIYEPDKLPKSANIAEPLLAGKNRKLLKMEDVWKIIKDLLRIHDSWEESSLKLYQEIAAELLAKGDIAAFNFVGEIIKEVKEELVYVTNKVIELNAMDWEMSQIVSDQVNYFERYEKLIRELLGKSRMYHRHNSALDAHSRTSVLDKYPDDN